MGKSFDEAIGPGEMRNNGNGMDSPNDAGVENGAKGLSEREVFALRCMNAAVHLYGILTFQEMAEIYNHYAKSHDAPVSDTMSATELENLADGIFEQLNSGETHFGDNWRYDYWYSAWNDYRTGERMLVNGQLTESECDYDGTSRSPEERAKLQEDENRLIDLGIARIRDSLLCVEKALLPEDEFLEYEEQFYYEQTKETEALAEFIGSEYGVDEVSAEYDVSDIVSDLNRYGATIANALNCIRDCLDWRPDGHAAYIRLVSAIGPVVSVVRTWEYRGHNVRELNKMGLIDWLPEDDAPETFDFGDDDDFGDNYEDSGDDNLDFGWGCPVPIEELPPAKLTGPFDFKSVKDYKVRDKLLYDYDGVRTITRDFVRRVVMHEMTREEHQDAAKRLGFAVDGDTGLLLDRTLDMVVGDFGSMMDDQHGDPAIKRVLKRKESLGEYDRAGAEFYENYRYTWLEVLAVKTGLGVKCRNLMTGEDLFLMEKSLSQSDVKGRTFCVGIAPMGEVYLALGVIHPAHFENPAMVLKVVLSHLGLSSELPVSLSFSDQARFAAETIRRIHANGKFDGILYG